MTPPQSELPADDVRRYLNEPEAWAQVSSGLQRIALAIVGNERDAEDVVQGAWLEALKNPREQQSQGWMRRLVRFRALDALRRKKREPIDLETEVPEESGSDMRWKLEAQREVLDAVNALKEPYLSTVMLRYFEGLGPKEIAIKLHVPERTIKTRLTRAHAMLRERLGARYQDQFGNWAPALVLFSGSKGLKLSPLAIPVVGLTAMKKVILSVAVLAVALMVPTVMQSVSGTGEAEFQPDVEVAELVQPDLSSKLDVPVGAAREVIPEAAQEPSEPTVDAVQAFQSGVDAMGGSLGVRVIWDDGSPAEHYKIIVQPRSAPNAFAMKRTAYTDATGHVTIEQLPPGEMSVHYDRERPDTVEIRAGEHSTLEKQAKQGTPFSGQVHGPSGQPVGGAFIFVADSRGGDSLPEPTVIADGFGRYDIKSVRDHSYVSARAPGFSPSIPIETGPSIGEPTVLDLTLRGNPATLRGLVLSPDGLPVVGAAIRLGLYPVEGRSSDGSVPGFPLPFVFRTDHEGRFESDQVGAGSIKITARTAAWMPWVQKIELGSGEDREITIQFEQGVELTGRVLTESGDPIPEALIFSEKRAVMESYRISVNERGQFHIYGLPEGPFEFMVYRKGFEELKTQVTLRSDTANQVDFILHELQSASGIVVDEQGTPLSRWVVSVEMRQGLWSTSAWTDEQGKFELLGIPDGHTDLVVTNESHWNSATRLPLPGILPAQGPLRIVVPNSTIPNSSIRMQIMVDGKPAPIETRITLRSASPLRHRDVHPKTDGSLVMEQLSSQTFQMVVSLEGYASLHRRFLLAPSKNLDLGTLELSSGGRIHVQVTDADPSSGGSIHVLDDLGFPMASMKLQAGEALLPRLVPGSMLLRFNPEVGATQFAEVQVVENETTAVHFTERPGTDRQITITRKNGHPMRIRTLATVTGPQGHIHFRSEDLARNQPDSSTATISLRGLEAGSYHLKVEDPTGENHESWLRVTSIGPRPGGFAPIQLDW